MTTFLSGLLRFGADAGVNCESSDKTSFTCDRIDTKQFIPNKKYLQRCVDNGATVNGARGATDTSRAVDGLAGVQVDGTIWSGGAVRVGGGPEIRGGLGTKSAVSWTGTTDFVYAYKLSVVCTFWGEVATERSLRAKVKCCSVNSGSEESESEEDDYGVSLDVEHPDEFKIQLEEDQNEFEVELVEEDDIGVIYDIPVGQ
ncbi:hypothetical protein AA0117_g11948 [Alternaria alternata]|uniref:Uncharacterized protein n=1 Tax=Alternaria alternata TaxID=5599 RepID=A0A4Q4N051_ALTAL|nr:hypothetical protein AA0117_g11948 [Alternaria alternata]RYO68345.1 hypothetical protein AA0116_g109 [Alternaria tenuissima]